MADLPINSNQEKVALDNCSKEPIHIPGRVQDFAAVIGFDLRSKEVVYQSENCAELLKLPKANFLGEHFEKVVTNQMLIHGVNGVLGLPSIKTQRERAGKFQLQEKQPQENPCFEVGVFLTNGIAVVEFEPVLDPEDPLTTSVATVRSMLGSLNVGQGMEKLLESAVQALRSTTGYDRVMAYRFLEDGDGEVTAEARSPKVSPYLGLRYPAYDVPSQVRDLMLRMQFRTIVDVHGEHSSIIGSIDKPLDLTMSHCRGVSPIHIEYLKNMGVASSMNTSIVAHGELWGMFAFHHYRPRLLTHDQRVICELFSQLFSMQIQQEAEKQILQHRKRANSTRDSIRDFGSEKLEETLGKLWPSLIEVVDADGLALVTPDAIKSFGDTPQNSAIRTIVDAKTDKVISIDSFKAIENLKPKTCGKSAGLLAMDIDAIGDMQLAFFRNEVVHEVKWGGEPVKQIKYGENGPRLHPRASFEEYSETIRDKSRAWRKTDLSAATELRAVILEVMFRDKEISSKQWQRQERYQDILIGELNHRVKNILALVRSISRQTVDSSHSLEVFTAAFEKRITALSTAHDLIGGSGMQWAPLSKLLRVELSPYINQGHDVGLIGVSVGLRTDIAPVVSLVIHELVTNSAKHGALSKSGTKLSVDWSKKSGGLSILWKETGLDFDVDEKRDRGFGLTLIERAIPYECNGESKFEYQADGVEVRMWLPGEAVLFFEDEAQKTGAVNQTTSDIGLPSIGNAFIVEDNLMLALDLEKILKQLGCESTTAVPSVKTGMKQLEDFSDYSIAIMDINLGTETSFELAKEIQRRGIPIVFTSGYDDRFDVPEDLSHCLRLSKPIDLTALSQAIDKSLG